MTREERLKYENSRTLAVYPISFSRGVEIKDIVRGIEDYVIYKFGDDFHKAKIIYDSDGGKFRLSSLNLMIPLNNCIIYA